MGDLRHRLSDIDIVTKTAICIICGPVGIYCRPGDKYAECRKKRNESKRNYYRDHPESRLKNRSPEYKQKQLRDHLKRNKEIRLECIEHYGGKCIFCGNSNPRHLTFDHINGGGTQHRKRIGYKALERWLKRNNFPNDIQLLCWNHNLEKHIYKTMT